MRGEPYQWSAKRGGCPLGAVSIWTVGRQRTEEHCLRGRAGFGSIEPTLLEKFALAIPDALIGAAKAEQGKAPGLFGILKIFRSENLRHGLAVVNSLLEAWGRNFAKREIS